MIDFSKLKKGNEIEYLGDSWAFSGQYTIYDIESTYMNLNLCPESDKGKLVIIEFQNNDTPMFFTLDMLNPNEWKLFP